MCHAGHQVHRHPALRLDRLDQPVPARRGPPAAPPTAWWRWPTTSRPGGGGSVGSWEAPPGSNLLVSVLLRPDLPADHRHLASAVVALAAADAVDAVTGAAGGDQMAQRPARTGRTQAGRCAGRGRPGRPPGGAADVAGTHAQAAPIVVGIGINVNWPRADDDLPPELVGSATSLCQLIGTVRRPDRSSSTPCSAPSSRGSADLGLGSRSGPAGRRLPGPVHHARDPGPGGAGRRPASRAWPPT